MPAAARTGHKRPKRRVKTLLTALIAAALTLGPATTPAHAADTTPQPPDRIIDVVQVTWPGAPTPDTTADKVAGVVQQDTIARWKRISNGQIVFQFGQTLPTITTRAQMPCDAATSIDFMNAVHTAAYQRAQIQDTTHRFLIILSPAPTPNCVWDGRGTVNEPGSTQGKLLLKNTDERTVIAHELGHNLGLGHSNYEKCNDGRADGPWTDCTAVEYGSATDLMSNNDRSSPLNAYHQWRMGWIADTDVAVGNKNLTVKLNPVDTTTGTRALFIRDKTAAYWVEYRKADPENQIDAGLVIYRSDPPPATAVESPIASDQADPIGMGITNDIWMISLGNYRYTTSNSTGSPSLASGKLFTTAFGGASLIASENADGTASVTVSRTNTNTAPTAPEFTDQTTWRTPDALLLEPNLDDNGVGIDHFDARMTANGATKIERVKRADSSGWSKTYLSPIAPPANLKLGDLPEGRYQLEVRAVDALGNAGAWSQTVTVKIDRWAPVVTNAFTQTIGKPGQPVKLTWTGATDKGSGVCRVQVFNEDGFALYKWISEDPGTPTFTINSQITEQREAVVYDCLGNGVVGNLSLKTQPIAATKFKRTGTWKSVNGALKCSGTCTASLKTPGWTTSIGVTGTGITAKLDGKPIATPKLQQVSGTRAVTISGRNLTLTGAQQLTSAWTQTGTRALKTMSMDPSLNDPTQRALAALGFSQSDFSDSLTVWPLSGGTTTKQGTLDLCGTDYASEELRTDRRQVFVSQTPEKYVFLSTETVRYQSAAAVQQALKELDEHVAKCKADGFALNSAGAKQTHEFLPLPTLPSALVPEKDRRIYLVNIGESGTATMLLAAYQFSGDTLNALYVVVNKKNSIGVAEQSRWLNVATILAQRLRGVLP